MDSLRRSLGLIQNGAVRRDPVISPQLETIHSENDEKDKEESGIKVKSKLVNLWNNVKYGKTIFSLNTSGAANFSGQSPVWLLGQFYHKKHNQDTDLAIDAFMADFSSRIWLTYRREFEEFQGTSINTDCGWGCMIRSGQMMVSNALLLLHLGRHWRWKGQELNPDEYSKNELIHRSIVRLFGDSSCEVISPLSIHRLVSIAHTMLDRKPGDWFGPAATAHLLKAALEKPTEQKVEKSVRRMLSNFRIYVAHDTTVYKQDIIDLCTSKNESKEPSPQKFDISDEFGIEAFSLINPDASNMENPRVPYLLEDSEIGFVGLDTDQIYPNISSLRQIGEKQTSKNRGSLSANLKDDHFSDPICKNSFETDIWKSGKDSDCDNSTSRFSNRDNTANFKMSNTEDSDIQRFSENGFVRVENSGHRSNNISINQFGQPVNVEEWKDARLAIAKNLASRSPNNKSVPQFVENVEESFVRLDSIYSNENRRSDSSFFEVENNPQTNDDVTKYFSLGGHISVDGQEWTVESEASEENEVTSKTRDRDHSERLYPRLSPIKGQKLNERTSDDWTPVLILVPVRLGSCKFNPMYGPCIQALLADPTCVGIIGGRPKHSLYFVGFQDENLIHLDPHLVQDRVDVFRDGFSLDSFHCSIPRKMALGRMDPSCCFGFLISSRCQFEAWFELTKDLVLPPSNSFQTQVYPIFSIEEGRAKDIEKDSKLKNRFQLFDSDQQRQSENVETESFGTEDFVFL